MSVKKRIVLVGTKNVVFCVAIAVLLAVVGSASAQLTWGPAEDVVVQAGDNIVENAFSELGWDAGACGEANCDFQFNSLTVTGGYLEAERLYSGTVQEHVINISGGHLKERGGVATLGYDHNSTINQSGGILETSGFTAIGRSAGTTEYNLSGGQLLIGSDTPGGNGNLYMPGNDPNCCGGYGSPGVVNFSGGEIVIKAEDWSPTGLDIIGQSWFNAPNGATATWDGQATTVTVPEPACLALMGLGGLMMLWRRRA